MRWRAGYEDTQQTVIMSMFCITPYLPHWGQIWGRPMRSSTHGLGSVSWRPTVHNWHLQWVPAHCTLVCQTDLTRCGPLPIGGPELHGSSQGFCHCWGIQAIYLFSSCYLEGATLDVLMGPRILCQAEKDLYDSFLEWIMEFSLKVSEIQLSCEHDVSSSDVFIFHTDCHRDWLSLFFLL